MNNRGISKTIVLSLIMIIFIFILGGYTFFSGFNLGFMESEYGLTISPNIYSSEHNIGVLNELAMFEVRVWNKKSTPIDLALTITAEDEIVSNTSITIDANSSRNETLTQRLSDIGMWKVKGIFNQRTLDSYSFETLINKEEADEKIIGYTPPIPFDLIIGIGTLILAIFGAIIGYLKYKKS